MFGNLSALMNEKVAHYPVSDSDLPFSEYIACCRSLIKSRRADLQQSAQAEHIVDANSPYELTPHNPIQTNGKLKYGALLIHGLFDCPFSLRDLGSRLQANGILCRSILLPGHGTTPNDLLHVSYHDWIQAVRYGIETLRDQVDHIFMVGYSTGAALSVHQALHDAQIAGLVLLSPAIKIKSPVDIVLGWQYLIKYLSNKRKWVYREREIDYAKYLSIGFNPVRQVSKLTEVVDELYRHRSLNCPILMIVSREDEVISSHTALDFFSSTKHKNSELLLYSSYDRRYPDARITARKTHHPELNIKHFSHVSIPFAPNNSHYGIEGDYLYASRPKPSEVIYGAFNRVEESTYDFLHRLGVLKLQRRELTYNPDFDFMANKVVEFVKR